MTENWMPSEQEIVWAWNEACGDGPADDLACDNADPIRALIREAVEKAVAEDRAKDGPLLSCPVCFATLSGCIAQKQIIHVIECADKLDRAWQARHARELERAKLKAKLRTLHWFIAPEYPSIDDAQEEARKTKEALIALAALDKEEKP